MKNKIFSILIVLFSAVIYGQTTAKYGKQFDADTKFEKGIKMALPESSAFYMQSYIDEPNIDKLIIRKFDQNNNIVNTYAQEFPKMEKFSYINYLGSMESGGKIAFFTENYSGKQKKKDFYKVVFDKATAAFTATVIASYPIESVMKSGTAQFEVSENGRFGAIVYYQHSPKKEPSKIAVIAVENGSFNQAWKKDLSRTENARETDFVVTNSGNVGLIRIVEQTSMMLFVSANSEEEKFFSEKMIINSAAAVSMGSKDYLVAFNAIKKTVGINPSVVENVLLYDLKEGKIIANNPVREFDNTNLQRVQILSTYLGGDKIYVFTESRMQNGTRMVNNFSEKIYVQSDPKLVEVAVNDGSVRISSIQGTSKPESGKNNTMGMAKVKGNYIVKTSYPLTVRNFNIDTWNSADLKITEKERDPYSGDGEVVNAALLYNPESGTLIYPRKFSDGRMSIISLENFTGK